MVNATSYFNWDGAYSRNYMVVAMRHEVNIQCKLQNTIVM